MNNITQLLNELNIAQTMLCSKLALEEPSKAQAVQVGILRRLISSQYRELKAELAGILKDAEQKEAE